MKTKLKNIKKLLIRYYQAGKIFRFFYRYPEVYYYVGRSFYNVWFLEKHQPRNLVIKLSEVCNARCYFCYAQHEKSIKQKEKLTLADFKQLILAAKKLGCYTVTLSGGEPLLYPHLLELIKFIRKNHLVPFTTTNGLSASFDRLKELSDNGLCALNWSIHGLGEIHNQVVGIPNAFDMVLANAKQAVKLPMINIVNHVLTKESYREHYLDGIIKLFMGLGFRAINLLPICMNGNKDILLNKEELKYLDKMAAKSFVLMDTKNYVKPICPAAREDIFVNNYGEVQPCPFIPISFGNVKQESLANIFKKIQEHEMFKEESSVCMPARDYKFIKKYLENIFINKDLPCPIEKINNQK